MFVRSFFLILLASLAGCTTAQIVDARFDGDVAGKPPSAPQPNPPGDNFIWTTNNSIVSTLVARPGGGQWVRMVPVGPVFPAPDNTRKQAMLALSAPLMAGSAQGVRGGVDLNISGHGAVVFGVAGVHGPSSTQTNLGGVRIVNSGLAPGSTGTVTSPGLDQITGPFALPGTGIGPYQGGQTVEVRWSIDQSAHTITFNTFPGGGSQTMNYPVTGQGVATTPLAQISLAVFLDTPAPSASVFVDNITVEQF